VLAVVKQLVKWVEPVFTSAGYAIVAGAVLMERSIFLGLIVPGDVILALGGVYAGHKTMNVYGVIALGTVAAICGESIGFWLGNRYGRSLIRRIPLVRALDKRFQSAEEYFKKRGGITVAVGRYATAAGAFVPFVAGMSKMRFRTFLAYDVPAIIIWATGITLIGYFFGSNLDSVDRILKHFGFIMLGVLILLIGGNILWKRLRRSKDQ